jgi:hypothetical protein
MNTLYLYSIYGWEMEIAQYAMNMKSWPRLVCGPSSLLRALGRYKLSNHRNYSVLKQR